MDYLCTSNNSPPPLTAQMGYRTNPIMVNILPSKIITHPDCSTTFNIEEPVMDSSYAMEELLDKLQGVAPVVHHQATGILLKKQLILEIITVILLQMEYIYGNMMIVAFFITVQNLVQMTV